MERIGNQKIEEIIYSLVTRIARGPILTGQIIDALHKRDAGVSAIVGDIDHQIFTQLALHANAPAALPGRREITGEQSEAGTYQAICAERVAQRNVKPCAVGADRERIDHRVVGSRKSGDGIRPAAEGEAVIVGECGAGRLAKSSLAWAVIGDIQRVVIHAIAGANYSL